LIFTRKGLHIFLNMIDNSRTPGSAVGLLAAVLTMTLTSAARAEEQQQIPRYAPNGDLLLPTGFETWVFIGSNLGMAYRQGLPTMTAQEAARSARSAFHNVYINPEAYAYFRATRKFPESTILVMENFAASDKEPSDVLASGVFNGDRVGLEVAVKNSSRPDGRTTPWAYHVFTDGADGSQVQPSARPFPDQVCEACHRQHAGMDNVWVQFYPTLRRLIGR
jgi:hypothetical protein